MGLCLNFFLSDKVKDTAIVALSGPLYFGTSAKLTEIRDIIKRGLEKGAPNFFAMGYYLTYSTEPLPELPVEELNVFLRKYLDDNFMFDFRDLAEEGIKHSFYASLEKKKAVKHQNEMVAFHVFAYYIIFHCTLYSFIKTPQNIC